MNIYTGTLSHNATYYKALPRLFKLFWYWGDYWSDSCRQAGAGQLQRVGLCCSYRVLSCVAVCWSVLRCVVVWNASGAAFSVCWRESHCVAVSVCCSVLQCVAVCCDVLRSVLLRCCVLDGLQCIAVYSTVLRFMSVCGTVCFSMWHCMAVCCGA